jgi:F0F1-type ATP synthase assembly protein I
MPDEQPPTRDFGAVLVIGGVGVEIVASILVGAVLDSYMNWAPWGILTGLVVGFTGGMLHLIVLMRRFSGPSDQDRTGRNGS